MEKIDLDKVWVETINKKLYLQTLILKTKFALHTIVEVKQDLQNIPLKIKKDNLTFKLVKIFISTNNAIEVVYKEV